MVNEGTIKTNSPGLFNIVFFVVSAIVFLIVAIRCAIVPFHHDEVASFYYYIQTGDFLPFQAHIDANNHFLNSFLSWICFKIFGDSPFSLRLPNLLSLIILIIAAFRISKSLTHTYAKFALLACFLLSFHWLSFFSNCRGYGISMGFFVLGMSCLSEYFQSGESKKLFLFYLFMQIAISANLILVIITVVLTVAVIAFQLLNKAFLKKSNIIILLIHLVFLCFWLKFSFFLQDNNALYYGHGNNYWKVTFLSLIQLISGTPNKWIAYCFVIVFAGLTIGVITLNFQKIKKNIKFLFAPSVFFTLLLSGLIVLFYGMKIFLKVNYPEDRTGLFFYVFFVLAIVYTLDYDTGRIAKILAITLSIGVLIHFIMNINFRKHSMREYATIPERFYTRLLEEQRLDTNRRITIGGHRMTELMYGFMNYRHGGTLNLADPPEEMHMDCDYYIAWKKKEQYYNPYYETLDEDKDWGYTLLKRKQQLKRTLLVSIDTLKPIEGNGEYYNLYVANDSIFKNRNSVLIEINLASVQAEMPLMSWLVLEIDTAEGKSVCYKRIPLNWLRYDWTNVTNQKLCMVSGELPKKIYKLICYLWNLEKKEIKFKVNYIKIYQLEGEGVNAVSK